MPESFDAFQSITPIFCYFFTAIEKSTNKKLNFKSVHMGKD